MSPGIACCAILASATAQVDDLQAELEQLVDAPRKERAQIAAVLAKRKSTTVEQWVQAMRAFGRFEPAQVGHRVRRVDLWTSRGVENTEIHRYLPPDYDPAQPAPLLLAAHGTGGNGRNLARMWKGTADALGMIVIAPTEAGENAGYAFSARERESALSAIRWARRTFNIDENRIFATGISRGGHLAWDLALRWPDLPAAIAPMIGGPRLNIANGQNNLRYLENVARLPIRDLQGAKDDPWLLFNLRYAFERLGKYGATDAKLIEFENLGHSFELDAVDWVAFFGNTRRDPSPAEIVRLAARAKEGRAFWLEVLTTDRAVRENFRPRVRAREWEALDDQGQRRFLQTEADQRTARIEARSRAPGKFEVTSANVRRFRLLLTPEMLDADGRISVRHNGKQVRRKPVPSRSVLLREFAERFDRTFLPTAEVRM